MKKRKGKRKLIRINSSYYINVPKSRVKDIKKGLNSKVSFSFKRVNKDLFGEIDE